MSTIVHAASTYMKKAHGPLNQPDLVTFHVEYLSRTTVGPATITITPLKLGRQFSTLRMQLLQPDPRTGSLKACIEALVMQGNLSLEATNGLVSLDTVPWITKSTILRKEDCAPWDFSEDWVVKRPAAFKTDTLLSKESHEFGSSPQIGKSVKEQWMRWLPASGKKFTVEALPYVLEGNWYPTVNFGMDIKRGGEWEWLYVRIDMHDVNNGRYDQDVVIADEDGNVIATSRHACLIVSGERNIKGRIPGGEAKAKI